MSELLDLIPDTVAPASATDDEANQPEEIFDSLNETVELSDAIHDAPTLEALARVLEQHEWEEDSGQSVEGERVAHQIRELDHLLTLDLTDEVQQHIDRLIALLPIIPDLQDTVARITNRGEN